MVPRSALLLVVLVAASCGSSGKSAQQKFCEQLAANAPQMAGVMSDKAKLTEAVARFESLEKVAPDIIKADWGTLTKLFKGLESIDVTDPTQKEAALGAAFSTAVNQASKNVDFYAKDRCKVDLKSGGRASQPSTPTSAALAPTRTSPRVLRLLRSVRRA